MSAKHTRGPWTVEHVSVANDLWVLRSDSADAYLADIYGRHGLTDPQTTEEGEANARLIADAPALLAALVLATQWVPAEHRREMDALIHKHGRT